MQARSISHGDNSSQSWRKFEQLEPRILLSAVPLDGLWQAVNGDLALQTDQPSYLRASEFDTYSLDTTLMQSLLNDVPPEFTDHVPVEINLPRPDGRLERFQVFESPVMAAALANKFPEIRTYRGTSLDDPTASVRFDMTPAGLHAQILTPSESYYIDPYFHRDSSLYASYFPWSTTADSDWQFDGHNHIALESLHGGEIVVDTPPAADFPIFNSNRSSGNELRTYRLAVAATGEYTSFHGGSVAAGQAAIATTINRVNGLYERELSIRFELVDNNHRLVYTNGETDPYFNGSGAFLLNQNQNNIDNVIGNSHYDIGHLFSTDSGGIAAVGSVGRTNLKAQGISGFDTPIGDRFFVDLVSHEIGHQFSARHTFNGNSNSCSIRNHNETTAYEPGSGSTIMGYAGLCGDDNLQPVSDPYFHSDSLDQIIGYADGTIPNVGTRTMTGNNIPTVNAGADFTIPAKTPFTLTATANDTDPEDVLTYVWEQRDLGPQQDVSAGDNGSSPLFRSWPPTTNRTRDFPRLTDRLNNVIVIGETLPTTTRTMNFQATVRDNHTDGGAFNHDAMVVHVVNTGVPFQITSPNTAVTWTGGTIRTVAWDVAGTVGNEINASHVNILLSTDGGNTFPTTVLANTPNDGSQEINVPDLPTETARIRIEGAGNIFYDVTDLNFTIVPGKPGVVVSETTGSTEIRETGTTDTYSIALLTVPAGPVEITVAADSQSEVSRNGTTFSGPGGSVVFSRSNTTPQTITLRAVDDNDNEGNHTSTVTHTITSTGDPGNYPTTLDIDNINALITDNDVPGVSIIETGGITNVAEQGGIDTYQIALKSNPAGDIGITVTADADTEVSLDGTSFSSANGEVTFHRTNTTPQIITLRAIDDNLNEGNHTSTITHTITSSSDVANYPTSFVLDSLIADVTDNDVPGVTISESTGSTDVTEGGATDTYEVVLRSVPAGPVEITVSAGLQTEVSLDGFRYATSQKFSRRDRTPQTLFIRAINDVASEGPHVEVITHSIASTEDPANYPTSMNITSITVNIADNDLSSLVGIDFDLFGHLNPTHWTQIPQYNNTFTHNNLLAEDGISTVFDLTLNGGTPASFFVASIDSRTLPQHTQSIAGLAGHLHTTGGTITAIWNDLTPGTDYEIYVFGLENFVGMSDEQRITITGAGTPVSFTQQLSSGNLHINDEEGNNNRNLGSYAKIIEANHLGQIAIDVAPTASTKRLLLGGLAIRPLPSGPQIAEWDGNANVGRIGDGTTWGDTNNWTVDSTIDVAPNNGAMGDDLVFQPAPTVTTIELGVDRIANSIRFQDNYTLNGHILNVTTGNIVVDANVTATIQSVLFSDAGLTKTGEGRLVIGANAPNVVVGTGTLVLASNGSIQNLTVGSNATAVINGMVHGNLTNLGTFISAGDLNQDGSLTAEDIDLLHSQMWDPRTSMDPGFDLVANGTIDGHDAEALVHDVMRREFGDTDLDGDIDTIDFHLVAHAYNPLGVNSNNGWKRGDFDGDGDVDVRDFKTLTIRYAPAGYRIAVELRASNSPENNLFVSEHMQLPTREQFSAAPRSLLSSFELGHDLDHDTAKKSTSPCGTMMQSQVVNLVSAACDKVFRSSLSVRRMKIPAKDVIDDTTFLDPNVEISQDHKSK